MEYTSLGKTGLKVSRLCLGCMSYGVPERAPIPGHSTNQTAVRSSSGLWNGDQFLRHLEFLLRRHQRRDHWPGIADFAKRDDVVLATKVFHRMRPGPNGTGLSRKAIFMEIDASLERLRTDYVDLYQIHRWDYETPIEETLEALHDVVKAGKVRYLGASSMYAWQFCRGASPGRSTRLDAICLDAEPLQPAVS